MGPASAEEAPRAGPTRGRREGRVGCGSGVLYHIQGALSKRILGYMQGDIGVRGCCLTVTGLFSGVFCAFLISGFLVHHH